MYLFKENSLNGCCIPGIPRGTMAKVTAAVVMVVVVVEVTIASANQALSKCPSSILYN